MKVFIFSCMVLLSGLVFSQTGPAIRISTVSTPLSNEEKLICKKTMYILYIFEMRKMLVAENKSRLEIEAYKFSSNVENKNKTMPVHLMNRNIYAMDKSICSGDLTGLDEDNKVYTDKIEKAYWEMMKKSKGCEYAMTREMWGEVLGVDIKSPEEMNKLLSDKYLSLDDLGCPQLTAGARLSLDDFRTKIKNSKNGKQACELVVATISGLISESKKICPR